MTDNETEFTPEETGEEPTPAGDLPQVMTAQEVADLLRISYKVVIALSKAGDIPALMIAGQWRFLRSDIEAWLLAMSRLKYKGPELTLRGENGEM